jgi:hypothetical protein
MKSFMMTVLVVGVSGLFSSWAPGVDEPVLSAVSSLPRPLASWNFDDYGEVCRDAVGGHDGQVVGATLVDGRRGRARHFERAAGQYISVPYAKEFECGTFTVSAWVRLTRPPTFSGILGTRFEGEHTFDLKVNAAKVHGDIGDGEQWLETAVNFYEGDTGTNGQGGRLSLDRWYHVVCVIDGAAQEARLYLDADLKKTIPFQGSPRLMKAGQTMRIGASSPSEFMDGVIDDVHIWAVALDAGQIRALHGQP